MLFVNNGMVSVFFVLWLLEKLNECSITSAVGRRKLFN